MKKIICNLLTLLLAAFLVNTMNASNCITHIGNSIKLASTIVQQHPRDTTSYWVIANGYYVAFTKDTSAPNEWVYKSNTVATNIKTPDPAKKIAGATVTSTGLSVRVTIGSKMYLFRTMQSANMLRYMTVINNSPSSPDNPTNK